MQQNASNLTKYFTIGLSIGFIVLVCLIYKLEYAQPSPKANVEKSMSDYFIDDQPLQQNFQRAVNGSIDLKDTSNTTICSCPSDLYTTENITLVRHGENTPVFVPETLSPIQPDIRDKLLDNRHDEKDNGVLITIGGYAMMNEVHNWIELLKESHEDRFVVFCTDESLYTHLIITGFESQAVLIPDDWFLYDRDLFKNTTTSMLDNTLPRLSHIKTWVLQRLMYTEGISNVLYLDANQIMLHARTREYIQTLLHIRWDTQLIATHDSSNHRIINTGLVMIRTNAGKLKRLLASTIQIQEKYPQLTQQEAVNSALDQLELNVKSGMLVLLDEIHFPNGKSYFEKDISKSKGIQPYIIHANHKFGEERVNVLREHGFWKVNQDYVNSISGQVENMVRIRNE